MSLEDYQVLKKPYFDFRISVSNWREYKYHTNILFKSIEKIIPEKSELMRNYLSAKYSLKSSFKKDSISIQKFLRIIEKKINWTKEDEKEVKRVLQKKKQQKKNISQYYKF